MDTAIQYDIDQHLEEWKINGFTIFEDLIPLTTIDRIREAWVPYRDGEIKKRDPDLIEKRYNFSVPFKKPFVEPEIFEHPAVVQFLEKALGPDYVWDEFDSNTPFPGVDYQEWHRDTPLLFSDLMTPAYNIGVKFPLVDTFEDNGSFEVIPSTQYLADSALCEKEINGRKNKWFDNVFGSGAEHIGRYYPVRLNLKKGSLWMQDGRAFHRGTPNVSDHTRDELCMSFNRPWFNNHRQQEEMKTDFPQDLWDSLSDHARHVLRWQWIKES